jgi:acetyl-CoA C-acetyltransferase
MTLDPRTPVLVGAATAQRPVDGSAGVEPVDLMVEAVRGAAADAGAAALAARAGLLAVPEGNWSYPDPARLVADRIGATGARTVRADIGVPQATPICHALQLIAAGDLDVAVVVGGEAMASRLRVQRAGGTPPETEQPGVVPDEHWTPRGEFMADAEVQAGLWAPVEQYACIDNALRRAQGLSIDEHLDRIAELWAGFNRVARTNPMAAFGEPRTEEFLRVAGPGNRPLAFPYAKWHVTQWSVDQAAALILCSAATARDAGVPVDRWVFPHVALESSFSLSMSRRADIHRWPAMQVLGAAATERLGRPLAELEHIECYSCFPAAVRVQQLELGLPADGVPTFTGGMPFAGGPFNNFTYQVTAALVERLRVAPDSLGLVSTVSGLLTKPGLAVWGATPPDGGSLVADLAAEAAAATPARDATHTTTGDGTVAAYTVTYADGAPAKTFVVADLADGRRWVGSCHDAEVAARATTEELVGATVHITGTECVPAER